MRVKERVVHRVECRKNKRGTQVILWGRAGRQSMYVLGSLTSKTLSKPELIEKILFEGIATE